jgi:hypothetical protein
LAPTTFLDYIGDSLAAAGILMSDWLLMLFRLQGISGAVAFSYATKHGLARWLDIEAVLKDDSACDPPRSYGHFADCQYRKSACTDAKPDRLLRCLRPSHSDLQRLATHTWRRTNSPQFPSALTQIVIVLVAFVVWVIAPGGKPFAALPGFKDYSGALLSIGLILFSGLIVPTQ